MNKPVVVFTQWLAFMAFLAVSPITWSQVELPDAEWWEQTGPPVIPAADWAPDRSPADTMVDPITRQPLTERQRLARRTLADVLSTTPELSQFAALIKSTGLDAELSGQSGWTILAPVNGAFNRLSMPRTARERLHFVAHHMIPAGTASAVGDQGIQIRSRLGKPVVFEKDSQTQSGWRADDSGIIQANIMLGDGIIHLLAEPLDLPLQDKGGYE